MNKLFIISGSSGVGKGTIIKELLKNNSNLKLSISTTTRQPRFNEEHGIHYFFTTKESFMNSVKNNEFIEWAEFSGNCYGTKKDFVTSCLNNGQNVLLEIDTQGALQIKDKMPEVVLIFIAPPSIKELENRLRNRNTESQEAIEKRLKHVKSEQENAKKYDYIVVNDDLQTAINEVKTIIKTECNG